MKPDDLLERRLRAAMLVAPVENDRLVLSDAVLAAAIAGGTPLSAGERAALAASPLTIRRFRQLALDRAASGAQEPHMAKGQKKSNKETRKPKKTAVKVESISMSNASKSQQATLDNIKKQG